MEEIQDVLINILTLWLVGTVVLLTFVLFTEEPLRALVLFLVPLAIGIAIYLICKAIIRKRNNN